MSRRWVVESRFPEILQKRLAASNLYTVKVLVFFYLDARSGQCSSNRDRICLLTCRTDGAASASPLSDRNFSTKSRPLAPADLPNNAGFRQCVSRIVFR